METNNIKNYAPKARVAFMDAVAKRLNTFGISANKQGELQVVDALVQGSVLQIGDNNFDSKLAPARQRLVERSEQLGYAQLVEQVAYTWFNRLCAIRYMEIHDYLGHGFRVLSHPNGDKRFEILDHAQDAAEDLGLDRDRIIDLMLAGDKNEELYRELLLGQCHKLHEAMPFLFESLNDETELLLPDNLTRTDSILRGLVDSIPEEDWQQVEVIGWLYQFYISDKKDEVIGKVVKSEDIPAATQLFTPNWIVKYMVQNSLGAQWLATYSDSPLKAQMEYYIEPAEQTDEVNEQLKAITPESIDPESIKVLDPASGSGHILIEAYNVLKAIYEERGYRSRDIPKLILENNLYGLDIDDRAAQLSGFSLMMMARQDDRRIFSRDVQLNVLSLQETGHLDLPKLWQDLNLSGEFASGQVQDMFGGDLNLSSFEADNRYQLLQHNIERFKQAKTFGSLIEVPATEHDALQELYESLCELAEQGDSIQRAAVSQIIDVVHQALILSIRYDAVVANPPYMGNKGMNSDLRKFRKKYPNSKSDLSTMFIDRWLKAIEYSGTLSMIVPQSWMFLISFTEFRKYIISNHNIYNLFHMDGEELGVGFKVCAFTLSNYFVDNYKTTFDRRIDNEELRVEKNVEVFSPITGHPLSYWIHENELDSFKKGNDFSDYALPKTGMLTTNNDLFVRYWWEVMHSNIKFDSLNAEEAASSGKTWFPYNKGGGNRKWFGNNQFIVNFKNNGQVICDYIDSKPNVKVKSNGRVTNRQYYFKPSITWSDIGFSDFSARSQARGAIFDITGMSAFPNKDNFNYILGFLNSSLMLRFMGILNPTFHFQVSDMARVPILDAESDDRQCVLENVDKAILISTHDWNSQFISPDFVKLPFSGNELIQDWMFKLSVEAKKTVNALLEIEARNDKIFSDIYGYKNFKESCIDEISLVNNYYHEGEWQDNMFISQNLTNLLEYIVSCTMGRYSLDQEGLVYAHEGNEGFDASLYKTFPADSDGIVPIMDDEWFKDDACNRVVEFVKTVWGEDNLTENLQFIASFLCLKTFRPKESEALIETIRRYLSTQFYKEHMQTYKNRPIFWLFSSGKEKAFECLVYLHRYNEGTLSRMRTEYVTPLLGKYQAYAEQLEKQLDMADTTQDKKRFEKELKSINKKHSELREFDDKLKHYADMRISIDLDDGVKANYGKFSDLLSEVKKITGKNPEIVNAN